MKDEVRIVYGVQYLNTKEKFEEAEIIKTLAKEQQELITSIIKIELDKGTEYQLQSAIKVLSFLLKLAKLAFLLRFKLKKKF